MNSFTIHRFSHTILIRHQDRSAILLYIRDNYIEFTLQTQPTWTKGDVLSMLGAVQAGPHLFIDGWTYVITENTGEHSIDTLLRQGYIQLLEQ
jgi:hypothetical protein